MRYCRGDELVLKVEDSFGYNDKVIRHVRVQIIAFNVDNDGDEAEYLVYVPQYSNITGMFTLQQKHVSWYNVDKKFLGDQVAFIHARYPISKHTPAAAGTRCYHCDDFFPGATKNDEGKFFCSSCKLNPYR